jgi:hypothetical protein
MAMADLIERGYLIGKFENTGQPAVSEMGKGFDLGIAAALRVVKYAPAVNRWISCEDPLPEPYETVIVAVYGSDMIMPLDGETVHDAIERTRKQGYVTTGSLDDEGFWNGCEGFPMMIAPSFWMPFPDLPEPPKE